MAMGSHGQEFSASLFFPWCIPTSVSSPGCGSDKDQRARAKCSLGGCPLGGQRGPGFLPDRARPRLWSRAKTGSGDRPRNTRPGPVPAASGRGRHTAPVGVGGTPRPRRRPRALQRHPASPQAVVGDSEYHHFRYRIPPARVRLLEVGGDLQLDSVKIF